MKKILIMMIIIMLGCSYKDGYKLIVGIIKPSLNHLPLDFALAIDILDREKYIIKEFTSGWETNEALISGKIDIAIMPFTYTWLDASNGYKVRIISFFERESDGIITHPDIKKLDHIQGKRIGVLRASTLDIFAEIMSDDHNIEMEFVYFRTPMDMAAALYSGEVDALSYYVPSIFKLADEYNIVYWYGDDYPFHTCCDISATEDAINSKGELIQNFLNGLEFAIKELNRHAELAYKAVEEFFGLYSPYSENSLHHTKYVMGLDEIMKEFELNAFNKMIEKGYGEHPVKPENVYFEIK
ncbi:MAG: ABC transporter substrate-binding protein [Candidatus Cloacimonetes bacterium]|nr:ABC transporter substrate-binding protein [Candidatus Cloacimonadota bacterium]